MTPYYDADGIRIYCGDCRVVAKELGVADVVLTDPPYDDQTHAGMRSAGADAKDGGISHGVDVGFASASGLELATFLLPLATRWVVAFCALEMLGDYRRAAGDAWVRAGFYRRTDGAPQFTGDRPAQPGEGLAIMHRAGKKKWNGGGQHAFYEGQVVRGAKREHPTQKSEAVMLKLVADFSDPGETVLDPFMGSGTTLVAARQLGRKAIGIEQSEAYCAVAVQRLAQGGLPLFG